MKKRLFRLLLIGFLILSTASVFAWKATYDFGWVQVTCSETYSGSCRKTDSLEYGYIICPEYNPADNSLYFKAALASIDGLPVTEIKSVGEGSNVKATYNPGCAIYGHNYSLWWQAADGKLGGEAYIKCQP